MRMSAITRGGWAAQRSASSPGGTSTTAWQPSRRQLQAPMAAGNQPSHSASVQPMSRSKLSL
jgi:hypothetical protein